MERDVDIDLTGAWRYFLAAIIMHEVWLEVWRRTTSTHATSDILSGLTPKRS